MKLVKEIFNESVNGQIKIFKISETEYKVEAGVLVEESFPTLKAAETYARGISLLNG